MRRGVSLAVVGLLVAGVTSAPATSAPRQPTPEERCAFARDVASSTAAAEQDRAAP